MTAGQGRRTRSRLRRLAWPAAAVVLGGAMVPVLPSQAQAAPVAPLVPSAPFITGSAQGIAQGLRIAPGIGSFQAAVAIGTSIAGFDDSEGKASAQNLDLGAIGTALTGPQCDGSDPAVKAQQLPQPLIAESPADKPDTKHADLAYDVSQGGSQVPAYSPADTGVLDAATTPTPSGKASTQGGSFGVANVIAMSGVSTHAVAAVVNGNARDVVVDAAVGSVTLGSGATAVALGNVTEHLHQRTGAGAVVEGSYSVGSLTLAGKSMPVDGTQLASSLAAVNKAIAVSGFAISLPVVTKQPDGTAVMSPFGFGVSNSALLHTVVAPVVGAAQPVRDQIVTQLTSKNCQTGNVFSIGDLFVTGPATGAGNLNFLVGGLSATSQGIAYASPFGNFGFLTPTGSSGGVTVPGTDGTTGTAGTPGTSGTTTGGSGTQKDVASPNVANAANTSVIGRLCETTHAFKHPACGGNFAVAVGLVGLAAIVLLGYGDAMASRGRLPRRGKAGLDELKL